MTHCPHCGQCLATAVPIGMIRDQAHRGRAIITHVANHYGMVTGELVGKRRHAETVHARHVAMTICRRCTKLSLTDIGELFGTDHSTALKGIDGIEQRCKVETALSAELAGLTYDCTRQDRTPAVVGGGPG